MADRKAPGERLSRRIAARAAEEGLHRRTGPDGGEMYSGPLASRALRAVGARAMTMDHTMFVAEDFDPSKAEDQALYAHEQIHMEGSGGAEANTGRDAEEVAARAIERMVLHRASEGESFDSIMRSVRTMDSPAAADRSSDTGGGEEEGPAASEAQAAYMALVAKGQSHEKIVNDLVKYVLATIAHMDEMTQVRSTEVETF